MNDHVPLAGRVTTGLGAAGAATSLSWFRTAVRQLWGFEPFAGTLNLIVAADWPRIDRLLLSAGTVLVPPSPDFCCSVLLPARIAAHGREVQAVAFRPLLHGYNPAQLEVLAPVHLRSWLQLQEGDEVTVLVETGPPARKWVSASAAATEGCAGPSLEGLRSGEADLTVELSGGRLHCKVCWMATAQGISVSLFGGIPHVGATALAVPRQSLRDPTRTSATSSVLTVTGHKDDELARRLAESLAAGLNRVASVTVGVHAGPEGAYDLPPEDLQRILAIVGRVDAIIRMAVAPRSV